MSRSLRRTAALSSAAAGAVAILGFGPASAVAAYCPDTGLRANARVQLWVNPNCQGASVTVPPSGNGDRPNFAAFLSSDGRTYNVDNSRSSLGFAAGNCVRVFDGANYGGEESALLCAGGSTAYYALMKFNDRVSSMRVCRASSTHHCSRTGAGVPAAPPPPPQGPPPAGAPATGGPIEGYHYQGARRCTGGAQPGALALLKYLQSRYIGRSLGIYNCRAVRGGRSRSVHSEGRALDWGLNANNRRQRAVAEEIVASLLATDGAGNRHALARRMGVQLIIWNRRVWSASRPNSGLRRYGGQNPHTDHIHIELNWPGARKATSVWAGR